MTASTLVKPPRAATPMAFVQAIVKGYARHGVDPGAHLLGQAAQRVSVVAVDLDRDLALLAADVLVDVVANRLAEVVLDAGQLLQVAIHLRDQVVEGAEAGCNAVLFIQRRNGDLHSLQMSWTEMFYATSDCGGLSLSFKVRTC